MNISYNKLWKLMIDKDIKKSELRERAGISSSSMAKLGKNKKVSLDVLLKLCGVLKCDIGDIMDDMQTKGIFNLLAQTASSNAKKSILEENIDNYNLKKFLGYLLNPFFITGISEKKIAKVVEKEATMSFDSFHTMMEYIRENNTGTDEVISNIRRFLVNVDQDLQEFYISIITKTARIGCDIKTVNKVFGSDFIPQWEVQQAYSIDKVTLRNGEWFSLSQKLNGVRGTFFEGKLISRQGKEFIGLEHILNEIFFLLPDADDWVLDGELVRKNLEYISDNENFRLGTGILSQDDTDKKCIQFIIFDILPKSEFLIGSSELSYEQRLNQLCSLKQKIADLGLTNIGLVDILYSGTDAEKIDFYLEKMVQQDKEGLMLNRNSKYFCKRHNGILKVKKFYTVDLRIVDTEEGSGRLIGKLGAFVVSYKGNKLNVGSGMSDGQREEFWKIRDQLLDRVIEIKYKEESFDKKTLNFSLQFPIFVQLREIGKEESYN